MSTNNQFRQVLQDLELPSEDMMTDPNAFITRIVAKSKELSNQLDARSTMGETEKKFKESAIKNTEAHAKAEEIFNAFYETVAQQDPEVLVHIMGMLPDVMQLCNNSIRSMSMRTNAIAPLSKRQINLLYIKLKKTYETYIEFMKLFQPESLPHNSKGEVIVPVIPPKKGNYSDYTSTAGIKTYEFIIDGESWINPFAVAKTLGLEVEFYMDLPLLIEKLQANGEEKINGHTVVLKDISKE